MLSEVQEYGRSEKLTVFPLVVIMVALLPLISITSPSVHASSGSSAHTCDPTMMFTGLPWSIQTYTINAFSRKKMVNEFKLRQKNEIRKLTITKKKKLYDHQKQNERMQMTLWFGIERRME